MLSRWIDHVQQEHQKPVLVVIDSFHKITASSAEMNKTDFAVTKNHSSECKTLAQAKKVSILTSLELNKSQQVGMEPTLHHITEARKIEYDFDTIATIYNPYHDLQGQSNQYVLDAMTGRHNPIVKLNFRKNKEGETGSVYMVYDASMFRMQAYSQSEIDLISEAGKGEPVQLSNNTKMSSWNPDKVPAPRSGLTESW
jgi:hypothetical protein